MILRNITILLGNFLSALPQLQRQSMANGEYPIIFCKMYQNYLRER